MGEDLKKRTGFTS